MVFSGYEEGQLCLRRNVLRRRRAAHSKEADHVPHKSGKWNEGIEKRILEAGLSKRRTYLNDKNVCWETRRDNSISS